MERAQIADHGGFQVSKRDPEQSKAEDNLFPGAGRSHDCEPTKVSLGTQLRCEVDQIVDRHALAIVGTRFRWKGLRRRVPFARHIAFGNRPFLNRPDRPPGRAIEGIENHLLGRLRNGFHGPAIDGDIDQHRRAGNVEIP